MQICNRGVNKNAEEINKKIQTEKDSFNRNLNRLQKQIFELKQRHQRTMEYWQRQKVQTIKQNANENVLKALRKELYTVL